MKYYKAITEKHDYFTGWTTVENELLTPRERWTRFRYLPDSYFEPVNISKRKIFINFGVRFEVQE